MTRTLSRVLLLIVALAAHAARGQQQAPTPFATGVDVSYLLEQEGKGFTWSAGDPPAKGDPLTMLAAAGADAMRVRLWTGDEGNNGLKYATETALRAQRVGLKPYLVIFLSEEWADYVKQPVPKIWKDLDHAAKCKAVEAYAERVTREFLDAGVKVELFGIGNEIDYGICGEFEEEWPKRVSIDYMGQRRWPRMAEIIAAAQAGVRRAKPDAQFTLHLTQWDNAEYCTAFWRFMIERGVAVDVLGLSYFPTNVADASKRTLPFLDKQVDTLTAALKRPVMICETGYPSAANFPGQFAEWNKPIAGYTLDAAGQARWIADLFAWARGKQNVTGVYYWSPEWYGVGMWDAFALFDEKGIARPGLKSFARDAKPSTRPAAPATQSAAPKPKSGPVNVYFGNLHAHTSYSDGASTPEEAYTFARDVAKIDFLAITEHNHLLGGEKATPEQRAALQVGPAPSAVVPTAERMTTPGKFVALQGQEFSSMSKGNHVNVLDVTPVIDVQNGRFDDLLEWMDRNRDSTGTVAVVQFNHPGLGRPGKTIDRNEYGRDDFGDDAGWVRAMGGVTSLIELLNGEPAAGVLRKRSPQIMEEHYRHYLQRGFRVAPTGNQDNHKKDWGAAGDTRTGIIATELTRPALLAALRARHVYATEDRNLKVIFRVDGQLCGDVLPAGAGGVLTVTCEIEDADEPNAKYTIEVFRGTVGGAIAELTQTFTLTGNTLPAAATEPIGSVDVSGPGQYVYFRITQRGEGGDDRVWTAPVWRDASR